MTVGLVSDFRNTFNSLVLDHFGHSFYHPRLIYLIRYFADDYLMSASVCLFYFGNSAYNYLALSCSVSFSDTAFACDNCACWKIRTFYYLHKIVHCAVFVIYHFNCAVDDFTKIMRRYGRSHTYGNTIAAVHKQVWNSRRKHGRLFFFFIKIRYKIYRFFIYIAQHL